MRDLVGLNERLFAAAGCHSNRRTEALLDDSPFEVEELVHSDMPRAFPTVRPTIRGSARRRAQ